MEKNIKTKLISWGTLPLGLVPTIGTPLQKGAEELLGALLIDRSLEKEFEWFYLLNDGYY